MDDLQYEMEEIRDVLDYIFCFKPYYKWMTFNTLAIVFFLAAPFGPVLNLIINGWPSILRKEATQKALYWVLNLIINGWPSILFLLMEIIQLVKIF